MPRTVQRAHKLRLYPTAEQRRQLDAYFGAARWVWNRALEFRSTAYRRRIARLHAQVADARANFLH